MALRKLSGGGVKKIILALLIFIAVERLTHWKTKGFRVHKMISYLEFDPRWEIAPLSIEERKEISKILDHPFRFLGSGQQFYVFESQDGQTVIKFIKHNHRRPISWINRIELPFFDEWRQTLIQKREKNLYDLMYSCTLAYNHLKEETGLIYAHLNKTDEWNKKVTLIDSIGVAHVVDLDSTEFLLQKRATLFCKTVTENIDQGKEYIDAFLELISSHCRKGIANLDLVINRNLGVHEERVVAIDFGSLFENPRLKTKHGFKRELFFEALPAREWIQADHPELLEYFDEQLQTLLVSHT